MVPNRRGSSSAAVRSMACQAMMYKGGQTFSAAVEYTDNLHQSANLIAVLALSHTLTMLGELELNCLIEEGIGKGNRRARGMLLRRRRRGSDMVECAGDAKSRTYTHSNKEPGSRLLFHPAR